MGYITCDNNYSTNKFIVSATRGQGNYLTIASAIAAASSGDTVFIKPGTYTENLTLSPGVNLYADELGTVIILGNTVANFSGTAVTCTGIVFKTNGANCISNTTGSPILNLVGCTIYANNAGAMSANSSSCTFNFFNCNAISGSGNILFSWSDISSARFVQCDFGNLGSTVTNTSLAYSRKTEFENCVCNFPIATNGSGYVIMNNCAMDTSAANHACIQVNNSTTGQTQINNSYLSSGSQSGITLGSGTTTYVSYCTFYNSNTYDIKQ